MKQQIPPKIDFKPVLDAIQSLQTSFDKEKTKPDILARKLDSLDQKLKDSHPEHMAAIKDIQTKIDPLHKATPQTSETLTKINDRVKAMHADAAKPHPDVIKKLDDINHHLKDQQNSLIEPMKQFLNEKLNPLIEQQTKKDGENKLGKSSDIRHISTLLYQALQKMMIVIVQIMFRYA
jgi:2-succinyl-5-enolpyruvyl-6-hydroxy-3-cyclohexene-1-carboxylate synthase